MAAGVDGHDPRACSRPAYARFGQLDVCSGHYSALRQALAVEAWNATPGLRRELLAALDGGQRERERQAIARRTVTYFARRGDYVKIGRTTNVTKRVRDLARGGTIAPEGMTFGPVDLLHTIEGDVEAEMHERFADLRADGEWFRFEGDLANYLAEPVAA